MCRKTRHRYWSGPLYGRGSIQAAQRSVRAVYSCTQARFTYLFELVCWLVPAEVVLEPQFQRMHHHLQWKQDGRLNARLIRTDVTSLKFPGSNILEKARTHIIQIHTASVDQVTVPRRSSTVPSRPRTGAIPWTATSFARASSAIDW